MSRAALLRRLVPHLALAVLTAGAVVSFLRVRPGAAAPQAGPDTLRFVPHPETHPVGWPSHDRPPTLTHPYAPDKQAIAVGAKLYVSYNCVDCHGADGNGSMGPSLADGRWHFGGSDGEVFESIYEGRPDGMPAWGGRISNDQVWMLVAYVQSLNGGRDVSTSNFSGRLVERSGH
ncbi:MAG: c-type cytochrome [Gemmatimonadetes bacterium]|nr:c-type cytochrome [Gemmatimonadota bacterium]